MSDFFLATTWHKTVVAHEIKTGHIVHVNPDEIGNNYSHVYFFMPTKNNGKCFIISQEDSLLKISPKYFGERLLPLGKSVISSQHVSFYSCDDGEWICAIPSSRDLIAARRKISHWEKFTLAPIDIEELPQNVLEIGAHIENIINCPLGIELIKNTPLRSSYILQAVIRSYSLSDQEQLSKKVILSKECSEYISSLFPKDIFAKFSIPELSRWLSQDNGKKQTEEQKKSKKYITIEKNLDVLASSSDQRKFSYLPYTINALARRKIHPNKDVCLIATARNEGIYLLEWIAYHKSLGIKDIFIYTNNNNDGSDFLLKALADAGEIYCINNIVTEGRNAQWKAYGHALSMCPEILNYKWSLIIDIDEFFVINPDIFNNVKEYLQWQDTKPCDAIALNWIMYGPSGNEQWEDKFIGDRFRYRSEKTVNRRIKTMFKPKYFIGSGPHDPKTVRDLPFYYCTENGLPYTPVRNENIKFNISISEHPSADFAWINHYFFKSAQEFLWKMSRNRDDYYVKNSPTQPSLTARFVKDFIKYFSSDILPDIPISSCSLKVEEEISRLKSLPDVAAGDEIVKEIYKERINDIVDIFKNAPGIIEAGEDGRRLLKMVGLS